MIYQFRDRDINATKSEVNSPSSDGSFIASPGKEGEDFNLISNECMPFEMMEEHIKVLTEELTKAKVRIDYL